MVRDACLNGAASEEGASAYVAVGFDPAPPTAFADPDTTSPEPGETVPFTVVVTDGNEDFDVPITITLTSVDGPSGTLNPMGQEGDSRFFEWVPDSATGGTTTLTLTVSNGFHEVTVTVTMFYGFGSA